MTNDSTWLTEELLHHKKSRRLNTGFIILMLFIFLTLVIIFVLHIQKHQNIKLSSNADNIGSSSIPLNLNTNGQNSSTTPATTTTTPTTASNSTIPTPVLPGSTLSPAQVHQQLQAKCDEWSTSYSTAITGYANDLINEEKQLSIPPTNAPSGEFPIILSEVNSDISGTNGETSIEYNSYVGFINASDCTNNISAPHQIPTCDVGDYSGISLCETIVFPALNLQ